MNYTTLHKTTVVCVFALLFVCVPTANADLIVGKFDLRAVGGVILFGPTDEDEVERIGEISSMDVFFRIDTDLAPAPECEDSFCFYESSGYENVGWLTLLISADPFFALYQPSENSTASVQILNDRDYDGTRLEDGFGITVSGGNFLTPWGVSGDFLGWYMYGLPSDTFVGDGTFDSVSTSLFSGGGDGSGVSYDEFNGPCYPDLDCSSFLVQWQEDVETLTIIRVSEPGTLALLGIGLFGMGLARRRKV